MASDRVKNLMPRLWMAKNIAESEALLDAFERETRLDEARWWNGRIHTAEWITEFRERIAKLAAQPTPEVKK